MTDESADHVVCDLKSATFLSSVTCSLPNGNQATSSTDLTQVMCNKQSADWKGVGVWREKLKFQIVLL